MQSAIFIISIISILAIVREDLKNRIIPDLWLWPLLLIGIYLFGGNSDNVIAAIFGYILGFVLMILTMKKEALGFGDVKLLSVFGLWLGTTGLSISVVLSCIAGIVWGIIRKEKYIAFAPFLVIGGIIYFIILKGTSWLI